MHFSQYKQGMLYQSHFNAHDATLYTNDLASWHDRVIGKVYMQYIALHYSHYPTQNSLELPIMTKDS